MRPSSLPLLLALVVWPRGSSSLQCRPGHEFWDSARQLCRACSPCVPPSVVLRPCGVHRDAVCGRVSDLNIDWSWIDGRRRDPSPDLDIALLEEPPRHHHRHHADRVTTPTSERAVPQPRSDTVKDAKKPVTVARKRKHKASKADRSSVGDSKEKAGRGKQHAHRRKHKRRRQDRRIAAVAPEASFLKSGRDDEAAARRPEAASQVVAAVPEAATEPEPFSAAETLVWDGQAFALALAVIACLFFFLVAAVYSIYQARHWRRLKTNFEADVEELSAQLSLVATGCVVVEPRPASPAATNPADVSGKKQCSYLEQLLARKQEREQANVYIERQSSMREPTAALSSMKE